MGSSGCVLVWTVGSAMLVLAGKDTDEELAHYIKKEATTLEPWTSNERRINKMIEEEIIKFNYALETTECPIDSQGKPRPTEGKEPTWWNAYRQAKDGDRPDWSAEINELIKNPRTYPPWTPSQESEPAQSRYKNMEPFTWRPGAPVINLRLKTDATTRLSVEPQEPTTERSIVISSAHWDISENGGGGGGTDPPLNLASLQKGFKEDNEYLKVKPRRRQETNRRHPSQSHDNKMSSVSHSHDKQGKSTFNRVKGQEKFKEEVIAQKELKMKRRKPHKALNQNTNFARPW